MQRFVVLWHEMPADHLRRSHFDFMLEDEGRLRTWALEALPAAGQWCDAQALPDHRPTYLDYEGLVSGERGSVSRFDRGSYELERIAADEFVALLAGEKLKGRMTIRQDASDAQRWRFFFNAEPMISA